MRLAFWSQNIFRESPTSPPARLGVCAKHVLHLSCLLRLPARDGLRECGQFLGVSPGPSTREFQKAPEGSLGGSFVEGRVGLNSLSERRPEEQHRDTGYVWGLGGIPLWVRLRAQY